MKMRPKPSTRRIKTTSLLLMVLLATLGDGVLANDDFTSQCNRCKCIWSNGRPSANCSAVGLSSIPTDLSRNIRDIDFSANALYELKARVFADADLSNVHRIRLQNCSLLTVHARAFETLALIIDLDLSGNQIKQLDMYVFRSNIKLRIITLSHNELTALDDGIFANLTHLQKVFLDFNKLATFSGDLFGVDCPIMHIGLRENLLTTIQASFVDNLHRLNSLDLEGNPWHCDCNLQDFRQQAVYKSLVTTTPKCESPERLRGRAWSENITFACAPTVLPSANPSVNFDQFANATIPCRFSGVPKPSVVWYHNNRPIDVPRNPHKFIIREVLGTAQSAQALYSFNLTIMGVGLRDRGEYKCAVTNDGGSVEVMVEVDIYDYGTGGGIMPTSPNSAGLLWLVILTAFVILVLVAICLFCYCCLTRNKRRNNHNGLSKNNLSRSSEMMSFDTRSVDGVHGGKSALITNVNPVSKPPRQYSIPPSVTSGGTEVSEVKKMLIDEDSCLGDEETRSFDFDPRGRRPSNHHLDLDSQYPPDLLPLPMHHHHHRGGTVAQVSPAASSASTVPDNSRLPPTTMQIMVPQSSGQGIVPLIATSPLSPMHHNVGIGAGGSLQPTYDNHSLMRYGTLPYSRSHSPFTSASSVSGSLASVPVRVPRHGYVTIPRKPRTSWSSEPPGVNVPEIAEPLYDNLGLRTTATGSSALSLNKAGVGAPSDASTPRSGNGRITPSPLGIAPIPYPQSPMVGGTAGTPCEPIVEHHELFSGSGGSGNIVGLPTSSPPPAMSMSMTLPRGVGGGGGGLVAHHRALSPTNSTSGGYHRGSWAPRSPEGGNDSRRESTASLLPSSEGRPISKVPPKPPPKPKKKANGGKPLFEDEGEDGTEV